MSKQALLRMAEKLKALEDNRLTDTEEYESLSEDYQSLAMSMLPLWDQVDEEAESE